MTVVKIKKLNTQKKFVIKRKRKFEDYKNCLKSTQLEKKKTSKKIEIDAESLKKGYKEFIRNKKLISNTQQRFKRYNVF